MTAYTPEWKVLINSVEFQNITLANLTITSGRTNIYEQAVAGYCNLSLIKLDNTVTTLDINDGVTVELRDTSGVYVPIFGGSIAEYSTELTSVGTVASVETINILALGALSRLPRSLTNGVLSKDFDGDQIFSILEQIFFGRWNAVPAALTWANYDPTEQWQDAFNTGLGDIDRPGNYELAARSSSVTDVYSLVAALATSGLGYIYEDASGRIGYADSTHRSTYLATNGYIDLAANTDALARGLKTAVRGGDVRNQITITYKNGQTVTDTDNASIITYGALAQNITTSLEKTADATDQAEFYLELRAYPQAIFDSISFNLSNDLMGNGDRDDLINVFMGMPVNITGLPQNMGSNFQGFVEGWTWTAGIKSVTLKINVTPIAYSLQAFRWNSVPVGESWNTISPTLQWYEATVVA
jgi:hypothetical protein